jgi:hypothetical protein
VIAVTGLSEGDKSVVGHAFAAVRPNGEVVIAHTVDAIDSSDRQTIMDRFLILALDYRRPEHNVSLKVELIDREEGMRAIRELAERENADLVCISSAGLSRPADQLMFMSQRSVLIVPESSGGEEMVDDEGCCFWRAGLDTNNTATSDT